MALDPVGIVVDLFVDLMDASAKLSEQEREKVKASLKSQQMENRAEMRGLSGDIEQLIAERDQLRAERDAAHAKLAALATPTSSDR